MKKTKINYTTPYADSTISGYVMADTYADRYEISQKQMDRAVDNLTIGGDIAPKFIADKPVIVKGTI